MRWRCSARGVRGWQNISKKRPCIVQRKKVRTTQSTRAASMARETPDHACHACSDRLLCQSVLGETPMCKGHTHTMASVHRRAAWNGDHAFRSSRSIIIELSVLILFCPFINRYRETDRTCPLDPGPACHVGAIWWGSWCQGRRP
jgi:hypothetical protein